MFSHLNFLAIAVATVVYFIIGALWFSVLFGKPWIKLTGITMSDEDKKGVPKVFAVTFVINFIICMATAIVIYLVNPADAISAATVGMILGIGFMAAPAAMNYMYARRPFQLTMIDAGYHVVAITVVSMILGVWR
ncbi:MAG: DUF1761 domain-containing protein [Bacteroidota bacterium]